MSEEGSEDSPPRPKRKIKKVMVLSSDSSSDSDDGVAVAGTRRKRLRVVSDEGSDSSGSSVVCVGSRRKRALPKLRDSDAESDTSGWSTDHSNAPKPSTSVARPTSGFASDSSEGNSEKCSICLLRFTDQEVGTPQNCEHIFCLDCITEWSKNVNTCPVDRITFNSIVVRACAGGRVLRTEPVKVIERRPSVEILLIEGICQVCGRTDNEETMLLCDGCDLGYHMACLTPPLDEVPIDQWLCPNCDDLLSDIEILFSDTAGIDMPLEARRIPTRESRSSRLSRNLSFSDEPSTSTGRRGNHLNTEDTPTTSRGTRSSHSTRTRNATTRRKQTTQRRRHKRRRTQTVIIEYEVQGSGKFPLTKRVKRKITKRKTKRRQTRTVARRTHVRESVRAKLESVGLANRRAASELTTASAGVQELCTNRQRAGIPALSLFGNSHQLDYFSEDDEHDGASESATTAVAARPTSTILSAYRQARRKMISIPSPTHASSAPDVLSSILESQTILHSKNSVVSISVDGSVNIKVEAREKHKKSKHTSQEKVDLSKGEDASKKVPSYPGQSRGGGGWGGGYRGNYHREQNTNNFNNRGGNYENSYGSGGYQNRQGNSNYHQNNNMRRDEGDVFNNFARRPHQYPHNDEPNYDRNRRQALMEQHRGPNMGFGQRTVEQQGRYSLAPAWQPYAPSSVQRNDPPPIHHRHSFGGFENPLDMRMGQMTRQNSANDALDLNTSQAPKLQAQTYRPLPEPPLPPVFKFDKSLDVDKSEDEKSDPGLVIDTEKYDPTEPTNDDDSADEDSNVVPALAPLPAPPAPAPVPLPPADIVAVPPAEQHTVQNILAGLDTSTMNVPPNVLDSAVRAVLQEHRNLIVPPPPRQTCSDDDSEGDCPNFSIYSATSVHIANNAEELPTGISSAIAAPAAAQDNLEDLVQEDDDVPSDSSPSIPLPVSQTQRFDITIPKKKSDEELKDKVSKRCPITTNPRNPIKIKLNTPSLIKRHMTLYDEEEEIDEDIDTCIEAPADKIIVTKPSSDGNSEKRDEKEQSPAKEECKLPSKEYDNIQENLPHEEDKEIESMSAPEPEKINTLTEVGESLLTSVSSIAPVDTSPTDDKLEQSEQEEEVEQKRVSSPTDNDKSGDETHSEEENDDLSGTEENDLPQNCQSPLTKDKTDRDDAVEKMTESISETEDERSYTPCLDENKSKETSVEVEKEKGIEGLDTEMISEDEGNGMFSDTERAHFERASPLRAPPVEGEEGEIVDKRKDTQDNNKKKKKKDSKKEGKDKSKGKSKKGDVAFKKLSKSGKERNYRERDKDKEKNKRERRESSERERSKQRRKERRKDLERYDVRTLVSEKRRRPKDAFGRDVSPRPRSTSRAPSPRATPPRVRRASSSPHRADPVRTESSPRRGRLSPSPRRGRISTSPRRGRPSPSPRRARLSPSPRRPRLSPSPRRVRPSPSPRRVRLSPSPRHMRLSSSPRRTRLSTSPRRARLSSSPRRVRLSSSPRRVRVSPSPRSLTPRVQSPVRVPRRRRRSGEREKRVGPRRRRSAERARKRRRSASGSRSPRPKATKRKKRTRSSRSGSRRRSPRRRSARRRRARRGSGSRSAVASPASAVVEPVRVRSPGSVDSRLLSPRTPPPEPSPPPSELRHTRRRRDPERVRHRRLRDAPGPSKEVFTSGDNILVSVSFKDQDRIEGEEERRERRRERRRRRKRAAAPDVDTAAVKPVAIIDLERSPFRELTPSPRNVIVLLSDEEAAEKETNAAVAGPAAPVVEPVHAAVGPKTPPEPAAAPSEPAPDCPEEARGPLTPPEPPDSPDAYDPYEPTRSASASPPSPHTASPPRALMTLEAAQKTNMSADDVIDRRPLSPIEKVMALLQSTRDVSPEEPPPGEAATCQPGAEPLPAPAAPAPPPAPAPAAVPAAPQPAPAPPVRIVLPSPTRTAAPKLFLAKPSPIKSDPIKPMPATKIARAPLPIRLGSAEADAESPYSPGSSDFGDLFDPPGGGRDPFDSLVERPARARKSRSSAAKVPVKLNRKKGKTQVGVKIDEDNLKILDDLPSSAVEMQVKSKFLKKLNRQERVVEEVKLVLKPHYNKKHVTKEEYKDILRRAVPKICHNKSGEINPAKIQALVEAYVKKFRKKHKLGLV